MKKDNLYLLIMVLNLITLLINIFIIIQRQ